MQKVAAYLLERKDDVHSPAARLSEATRIQEVVTEWLKSKGASPIATTGTYQPVDGSTGAFSIHEAVDGQRRWWMVRLDEQTAEGRLFSVAVSITASDDQVSVYVTLETGWTTSRIMLVSVDIRCPRVVRELLGLPGTWYHGPSLLRSRLDIHGFDAGEGVAAEIERQDRAVPLVVISTTFGSSALPGLEASLAYDLSGLANVVVIDEDASWALTDVLGSNFSCYAGAVRLYWPRFSPEQDRFFHPLWTADRLRSLAADPADSLERFRRHLRGLLFRASALSVVRPPEIDSIRDASERTAVAALRHHAKSLEEFKALADSYAADNDQLRSERADLRSQVESLQKQVAKLETGRQALLAHLQAAKSLSTTQDNELESADLSVQSDDANASPAPGDVRFYKKIRSRPTHDVMMRVPDCGCNNWQGGHAADKARKGVAKLENDRSDWKSIQHCASCTGGGMWRVRW